MSDATIERREGLPVTEGLIGRGLAALVGLALLLKLGLVFTVNVNWDEFHYLHWVHLYLRGELASPLQTFHVHFFTWLPLVSGNEVDQVIAGRLVAYLLGLLSLVFLYRIGRRFLDPLSTRFALLCFLTFSHVVEHGTSFRADPIASFLYLGALYLLLCASPAWLAALGAGLLFAAALMITIKSALLLPVVGLLLLLPLLRPESRGRALATALLFTVSLAAGFAALLVLHRATIGTAELRHTAGFVATAAEKVILFAELFPRWRYLLVSLINNLVIWACLGLGAAILARRALRGAQAERAAALPLLVFLLPLASFVVYRNAFPYFYAFILPLPMLACGVFFTAVLRSRPGRVIRSPKLIALGLVLAVSATFAKTYLPVAEPATALQRDTVALVHRLFPEPVAYIDRCDMIAAYPKVGFFMSTWGMENYLARGLPIFRELLARERPPFLIANSLSLNPAIAPEQLRAAGGYALFDEDHALLASNYVHHWGALYVAGKRLAFPSDGGEAPFEMLIPGTYTLESAGPVTIDGQAIAPGDTLWLAAGRHRAEAGAAGPRKAILRWGERLYRPADPAPKEPIFTGF